MTLIWTDNLGIQVTQTKRMQPDQPLLLNCDSIPDGLMAGFPCALYVDSTQPTAAMLTRTVTGSPVQSTDTESFASVPLFLGWGPDVAFMTPPRPGPDDSALMVFHHVSGRLLRAPIPNFTQDQVGMLIQDRLARHFCECHSRDPVSADGLTGLPDCSERSVRLLYFPRAMTSRKALLMRPISLTYLPKGLILMRLVQ